MCFFAGFCGLKINDPENEINIKIIVIFDNKFFERLCILNVQLESESIIFKLKIIEKL